ncbi:rhodanese-like domain-containing protein [Patescibacteria group bacterium]|nr:rhodanese-like domain-containing protein [Patescibacteria group bacterium]
MENYKQLTREELKKWIDEKKDFVLVDVLAPASYEGRHLPNAKNAFVKENDFLEKVEKLVSNKEMDVAVYCASFTCQLSPLAANKLVEAGYTNVYDFKGGLADWLDAGYSLEGESSAEKIESKCSCCN